MSFFAVLCVMDNDITGCEFDDVEIPDEDDLVEERFAFLNDNIWQDKVRRKIAPRTMKNGDLLLHGSKIGGRGETSKIWKILCQKNMFEVSRIVNVMITYIICNFLYLYAEGRRMFHLQIRNGALPYFLLSVCVYSVAGSRGVFHLYRMEFQK